MTGGIQPTLAELVALRAAVSGRRSARYGRHGVSSRALSPLRGRGMEYAESREYSIGDDARHIDWRLTARTGPPKAPLPFFSGGHRVELDLGAAAQRQRWRGEFSAPAKAIDYTLKRWPALARYLDDGRSPIDNNPIENAIRPIALGRKNWLFAGSKTAGQRAAAIMSLLATTQANGRDPHAWLTDVLTRLPSTKDRDLETLLPHRWQPAG